MNSIALKLKTLRQEKNMSQNQLADKSGVLRANIANYESGRAIPPADIYERLLSFLAITPDEARAQK